MNGLTLCMFVPGAILIVIGLFKMFEQNTVWAWTEWRLKRQGIEADRTDVWDKRQRIDGLAMIVIGILALVYALFRLA